MQIHELNTLSIGMNTLVVDGGDNMTKKLLILLIIVALILCGCKSTKKDTNSQTASPENLPEPYIAILSDYRTIVDFRLSNNFEDFYNNGIDPEISDELTSSISDGIEYQFSAMLVDMTVGLGNPSRESFGYILQDVNKDGSAELFWVREDYFILAVFSIQDGQAKLIDAFWPRHKMIVTDEGFLYTQGSSGADFTSYKVSKIAGDGGISEIAEFGTEGKSYYEIIDGNKKSIGQTRFDQLIRMYPFEEGAHWRSTSIYKISS